MVSKSLNPFYNMSCFPLNHTSKVFLQKMFSQSDSACYTYLQSFYYFLGLASSFHVNAQFIGTFYFSHHSKLNLCWTITMSTRNLCKESAKVPSAGRKNMNRIMGKLYLFTKNTIPPHFKYAALQLMGIFLNKTCIYLEGRI